MAPLPRATDQAAEMAAGLIELPPSGGYHLLFDSTIRAPLTATKKVGPRPATTAAYPIVTTRAEPNRAERHEQRAAVRRLEAQFRALYDTHFQAVRTALSRLGVRDADLIDLTQRVFLAAYLKMPQHDERAPVSAWLYGICRRLANAYRRAGAIRCEIICDPAGLASSIEHRGAAESEIAPHVPVIADHLLSRLSEKQRAVFILFAVVELSAPEVAAALDIPLETVRSRLRCGRERCRREARRLRLVSAFSKTQTSER